MNGHIIHPVCEEIYFVVRLQWVDRSTVTAYRRVLEEYVIRIEVEMNSYILLALQKNTLYAPERQGDYVSKVV